MRILMICERYPPELRSAAHLFQELAEGLATRDHAVTILTRMPTENLPEELQGKISEIPSHETMNAVSVVRCRSLFSLRKSLLFRGIDQIYLALRIFLRAVRFPMPDVVVVYSPPVPLAAAAALFGLIFRVPCVLHLHDLYPRTAVELGFLKNRFFIWCATQLENMVYWASDRVVVPSQGSARYLTDVKRLPGEKVALIHNWVDTKSVVSGPTENRFRKDHGLGGKFVISYAGLMGLAQDMEPIIQCARGMRDCDDIVYLFIGEGALRDKWRDMCRDLGNVRFMPSVPHETYFEALRASDVCLISLSATLDSPAIPGKLQNIMAVRRPVVAIAPPESEAARVVRTSNCGLVAPPGKPDALREGFLELHGNPALRDSLGDNGRKHAEAHFDLVGAISRFEGVIKNAAEGD